MPMAHSRDFHDGRLSIRRCATTEPGTAARAARACSRLRPSNPQRRARRRPARRRRGLVAAGPPRDGQGPRRPGRLARAGARGRGGRVLARASPGSSRAHGLAARRPRLNAASTRRRRRRSRSTSSSASSRSRTRSTARRCGSRSPTRRTCSTIDELRLATRYPLDLAVAPRDDIVAELRRLARASEALGAPAARRGGARRREQERRRRQATTSRPTTASRTRRSSGSSTR